MRRQRRWHGRSAGGGLLHTTLAFGIALLLAELPTAAGLTASYRASKSTLSFEVCNGFTNQRLSILYGFVLAHELGRIPVLPNLIMEGRQDSSAAVLLSTKNSGQFEHFYDLNHFQRQLQYRGFTFMENKVVNMTRHAYVELSAETLSLLHTKYSMTQHIVVDCPLLKLPRHTLERHGQLVNLMLRALRPSKRWQRIFSHGDKRLRKIGDMYNFMHLRVEEDWLAHCARPNMVLHTNCVVKMNDIADRLVANGLSVAVPLYVAADWGMMDGTLAVGVLKRLKTKGFRILLQHHIFKKCSKRFTREEAAMVDYFVALKAHMVAGNSVSTFSALAMLERHLQGRPSWHYNGGSIPLARYLPFFGVDEPEEVPF